MVLHDRASFVIGWPVTQFWLEACLTLVLVPETLEEKTDYRFLTWRTAFGYIGAIWTVVSLPAFIAHRLTHCAVEPLGAIVASMTGCSGSGQPVRGTVLTWQTRSAVLS